MNDCFPCLLMSSRASSNECLEFSLQKQNIRASRILLFPDPLGPIMQVKFKKGPTYFLSESNE